MTKYLETKAIFLHHFCKFRLYTKEGEGLQNIYSNFIVVMDDGIIK